IVSLRAEVGDSSLAETAGVPAPAPSITTTPRRRIADFGVASEQAEPINGEAAAQDTGSTGEDSIPSRLTGFSIEGRSRPVRAGTDQNENEAVGAPNTASLSDTAKSPITAAAKASSGDEQNAKALENEQTAQEVEASTGKSVVEQPNADASAMKEQSSTSLDDAVSKPSSALIQTQQSPSTINLPSNALDVEAFGLIPLIVIGISLSLALGIYLKQVNDDSDNGYGKRNARENEPGFLEESKNLLQRVKDSGAAGAISYALWEAAFWGVSIPVCLASFREVTGHWPDLTSSEDVKKVGLEAFTFVNFARLAVPIRVGLALSTIPWVEQNVLSRFNRIQGDGDVEKNMDDSLAMSSKEDQLNQMETEESRVLSTASKRMTAGIDPTLLQKKQTDTNRNAGSFGEYCEPGQVNEDCTESIRGYLDSLASTGAVATAGEVRAIVGYLDSLSSNVTPNKSTGAAFSNYLDALSTGYVPAPSSAKAVASYLDALSDFPTTSIPAISQEEGGSVGSRITEVEERLNRLESSVTGLPDDIASRLVEWQISQEKKLADDTERIIKLLVEGKLLEK
ncbi:hypothetical protein ACHAW5_001338, partial [Stephanodiscus triporus]